MTLEVGRNDGNIHAPAGVRPDTGQILAIPRIGRNLVQALVRLDGADLLLGHNLSDFDLPRPSAANPNLRRLLLPDVFIFLTPLVIAKALAATARAS